MLSRTQGRFHFKNPDLREKLGRPNLSILKNSYPQLVEELKGVEKGDDLSLIKAHSGDYTAKIDLNGKEIFLHSRYDPQQEASCLIRELDTSIPKIWFIIGLGLGYHLFELADRIDDKSGLVVIEKRTDLFKASLSLFNWSEILQDKRVKLIIGEELKEIDRNIEGGFPDNFLRVVGILEHQPSLRLYPQYYSKITDKLDLLLRERKEGVQKVTATIREDYERIDQRPNPDLHPQTKNRQRYFQFYKEQEEKMEYKVHAKDRMEDVLDCAEGKCLEVGCQFGFFTLGLARAGHFSVGVDLSLGYLKRANFILENEPQEVRGRVRYLQGWAEGLPFKDEKFQTVILGEILEHVIDPKEVLGEALRLLQAKCVLYISTPAYVMHAGNNPEHVRIFSERSLINLLKRFEKLDINSLSWYSRKALVGNYRLMIRKR